MSAPSSVPCPEPIPYSDEISGYADIDFNVSSPAVNNIQPNTVAVDSLLANQLGPVSNPVQPSSGASVSGFPVLPAVGESNAKPLLSSYSGADITAPMTLSNSNPNIVSINEITNSPSTVITQPLVAPVPQQFTNVPRKPTLIKKEQFNNANINANTNANTKANTNANIKANTNANTKANTNLAQFIDKSQNAEHYANPKRIEHFSKLTVMDNIVIGLVIVVFAYYIFSLKHGDSHLNTSKIPIVSQLSDKDVSTENKIIIVVSVVIACVLISRMMK